jgi:hypothetical protein
MRGHIHAPAVLPPGKELSVPIRWEVGWAPGQVLVAFERRKDLLSLQESNHDFLVAHLVIYSI